LPKASTHRARTRLHSIALGVLIAES